MNEFTQKQLREWLGRPVMVWRGTSRVEALLMNYDDFGIVIDATSGRKERLVIPWHSTDGIALNTEAENKA